MKRKRPGTRRRKASPAARLRPFWVPIALGIIVLLGAVAFLVAWPGFDPRNLEVTGNRVVSRSDIIASAGVKPDINMWLQNTSAIARRVETIAYVATARVHRIPPTTMIIAVSERVPFATVRSGTQVVTVDRDLRVLQDGAVGSPVELPAFDLGPAGDLSPGSFLTSARAVALKNDYDAMIAAHVIPTSVGFDRYGGLVATVRGGIDIMLGDDADMAKKLSLIDPILAQVVRKERRVAAVDLRAPGTPVVVYR